MPVKHLIRRLLHRVGIDLAWPEPHRLEIAWRRPGHARAPRRGTMRGALENMAAGGLAPATVIDVGAAHGTPELYETFPHAHHLLVEPLEEFSSAVHRIARSLDSADVFVGTAGAEAGEVFLNVHPDLVGSSLFKENEDSDVNGSERLVRQTTLDLLRSRHGLDGPFLLKIDTQGAELEVLKGAEGSVLPETEAVVLEVSLFNFFLGGPGFMEVFDYLRSRDLVPHDFVDPQYRPLDGALSQIDVVFVRADSHLRREHFYATREQRQRQNRAFRHSR